MMLCLVCHDKQPTTTLPSITTAQASATVYDDSTALPINQPDIFPTKERVQTMQEVTDNARAAYKRLQAAQARSFAADIEKEEDPLIPGDHPAETRNEGGCPIGSTIEHSQAQELAQKQAVNHVIIKYATHLEEREEKGEKDWSLASGRNWSREQSECLALKANLTYQSRQFIAVLLRSGWRSGIPAQSLHC